MMEKVFHQIEFCNPAVGNYEPQIAHLVYFWDKIARM